MVVKVYYSEISGSKEVKKRQQRVMMILDSKSIQYEAIDITEPGKEAAKEFMLSNAKPRGDSKIILSPQIFQNDLYCGDYDDFDLANENDTLEQFLGNPVIEKNIPSNQEAVTNGKSKSASREPSAEPQNGNNAVDEVVTQESSDVNSAPDEPDQEVMGDEE